MWTNFLYHWSRRRCCCERWWLFVVLQQCRLTVPAVIEIPYGSARHLIIVTALQFPLKKRLPRIRVFPVFIDGIPYRISCKNIRYTKRSVAVWESFRFVVCCCHCSCACLLHFDYRICNDPCHTVNALSPNMYIIVVQCNKFFFFFYV